MTINIDDVSKRNMLALIPQANTQAQKSKPCKSMWKDLTK